MPGRVRSTLAVTSAVLLVMLTLFAFWPALGNDFVNWDDVQNYLTNADFRGLGVDQIRWAWTTVHMGTYQPLAWMFTSLEYALWGLDPHGYHAASVATHACTVVLLYMLTLAILRRCEVRLDGTATVLAAVAVASYAIHPLRVEAVAWITAQANLLCGLFFVASLLAYLRSSEMSRTSARWLNLSLLMFVAALLCKAPAVGLPFVLLVLDVYPLRRIHAGAQLWASIRESLRQKVGFFLFAALFSIVAVLAKASTFVGVLPPRSVPLRLAAAAYSAWFYLGKMIAPFDLVAFYRFPTPFTWRSGVLLASLLSAVAVCAVLLFLRTRFPRTIATCAAFLILVAPVSGLVSISTQLVADRHTYLALMPWVLPVAGALIWWARQTGGGRVATTSLVVVAVGALLALTISTRELCRTWQNSETLWTHALAHPAGTTMMAYNNLAAVYLERGATDAAIPLLRTALAHSVEPGDLNGRVLAHFNLGAALARRGQWYEAVHQYEEMARFVRVGSDVHYRWGEALAATGQLDEAIAHYMEALRLDPAHEGARPALEMAQRRREGR